MLAWGCLAFLFFVSTLPFAASTLASHVHLPLAVGLYWVNLLGLGLMLAWQLTHIVRRRLADEGEALRLVRRRLIVAQVLYAVAAVIALLSPLVSIIALAVAQLLFIVSPRLPVRV
jgi:uncharacterized membrane protein